MPKKALFKKTERAYMIIVCIGLLLIGAGCLMRSLDIYHNLFEFSGGFGAALIGIGSVGIICLRKKPKSLKQQEVEETDERNVKIREKSAYSTFFVTLLTLVAAVIVFVALGSVVACIIVNIFMAVHVLSYLLLLHINNKKY